MVRTKLSSRVALGLLGLVVAISIAINFQWVRQNELLLGHDAAGHLDSTIELMRTVADQPNWIRKLFVGISFDEQRPPLLYLLALPFLRFVNPTRDGAQLVNIVLMGLVVIQTYVVARNMTGRWLALLAATILSLMPFVAATARLFYLEILLTAALLASHLFLLRAWGFERRLPAMAWGASLGIAMLAKWTAPIYLLAPVIYTMIKVGFGAEWRIGALRLPQPRRALQSFGLACVPVLAFYVPNRSYARMHFSGDLLAVVWTLGLATLFYLLLSPPTQRKNFWSAVTRGAVIASLWYLPRLSVFDHLMGVGFGTDGGMQESFNPLRFGNYTRYFEYLLTYHLGPLALIVIIPPMVWGWWQYRQQGHPMSFALRLVLITVFSALLILMLLAQSGPRNLIPLFPYIAVLMSMSLTSYRRSYALAIAAVWLVVLGAQFALFSFDVTQSVYTRTAPLWIQPSLATPPSTGRASDEFWIAPSVLERVTQGQESRQTLGLLVNSDEIFRGQFRYLVNAHNLPVTVIALTERDSRGWYDLLASQWVLTYDSHKHSEVEAPGWSLLERILNGDPLFDALYTRSVTYPLPDGGNAFLFHRPTGPGRPLDLPERLARTAVVAQTITDNWSEYATLVYADSDLAVWVGMHDPAAASLLVLDGQLPVDEQLGQLVGTLFVVQAHDSDVVQQWLVEAGYRTFEVGDDEASVAIYGVPRRNLDPVDIRGGIWGSIALTSLATELTVKPGQVLPVEMSLSGKGSEAYKASVRLIDHMGNVVTSHDRPVSTSDHFGLFIPPTVQLGDYQLTITIYDAESLAVIPDDDGNDQVIGVTIKVTE